ncbi:hypothetical protein COCVIDRAFT_93944 [Bipolaris victoriae FI3]|uniref:Uncharacterized protein n=1 Tax=Bipolaris victoriae (strain FI3) TaxID=930091 RepID=W7EEY3_BIPV3|nr:hypothetical protein COCVIDRAFT_93944 [Bipolaris victoriae FI3]
MDGQVQGNNTPKEWKLNHYEFVIWLLLPNRHLFIHTADTILIRRHTRNASNSAGQNIWHSTFQHTPQRSDNSNHRGRVK